MRIDPGGLQVLSNAAWLLSEAGEEELAAHYAARAVELYPDDASAWFARAQVLDDAAKLDEAEAAYRRGAPGRPT